MIKMYVIIDKYNEDFYWDFEKEDFSMHFSEKCLIPTKELAESLIEDFLGSDFVPAEITIYQYTKNGTWEFSVEDIWNEQD
ncbi:hypothetical protein [Paenibacillus naphthalenovorans]|uniref:hypothetical protein n=1 Tax=Paenibacillus naphthalenovorans TaxID=162209 RepID=UPI003D2AEFF1